jgi:hypothetical protein
MGFLRGMISVLLLVSAVAADRGEVVSLGEDAAPINWNGETPSLNTVCVCL